MREPAGTSYYLLDGLASVVAVTSAVGDVAKRYEYEPYGQAIPTTGSHAKPWRFASGYLDGSGFQKFGTRYYVPSLARWTQHDPKRGTLSNPKTLNLYAYVGGDPINSVDPTGAVPVSPLPYCYSSELTETCEGSNKDLGVVLVCTGAIGGGGLAGWPGAALGGVVCVGTIILEYD